MCDISLSTGIPPTGYGAKWVHYPLAMVVVVPNWYGTHYPAYGDCLTLSLHLLGLLKVDLLLVPRVEANIGTRDFSIAVRILWNSLPLWVYDG